MAWILPPIVAGCCVASTVRLAFCETWTLPVTVMSDRVHDAPLGTTTLPVMVPVSGPVQLVLAARTVEPPATSTGAARIKANAQFLVVVLHAASGAGSPTTRGPECKTVAAGIISSTGERQDLPIAEALISTEGRFNL
jgi:hypothetical protein